MQHTSFILLYIVFGQNNCLMALCLLVAQKYIIHAKRKLFIFLICEMKLVFHYFVSYSVIQMVHDWSAPWEIGRALKNLELMIFYAIPTSRVDIIHNSMEYMSNHKQFPSFLDFFLSFLSEVLATTN